MKLTGISLVSRLSSEPTDIDIYTTGVQWGDKDPNSKSPFAHAGAGYDFIKP
jgi:hypothetical protein